MQPRAVPAHGTLALIAAFIAALVLSLVGAATRPALVDAAAVAAGYIDHSYGPSIGSPTEDKPQSKVWFADGFWWGGLFVDGPDEYRIHKYNATTHAWTDTGVVVDERNGSHADYLWVPSTNSLYVASVNGDTEADPVLVFKFNYNPSTDTYALDPDFVTGVEPGLIVGTGPAETVTIARDSTGQLWVAYDNPTNPLDLTQDRMIMANRSVANEHTWGTAFQVGDAVGPDDISAIIAYGGNAVGIMMSEHRPAVDPDSAFHFWIHLDADGDTTWNQGQSISGGPGYAEDHINLKLTATSAGQVLAVLKTNDGPNHIGLFSRASNGAWTAHLVVGGGQEVTRPQVMIDETNARAYVFYTAPELSGDGNQSIYYKSAPLSTLNFGDGSGLGTVLIQDGTNDINDVATAKHNVTASMGGILAIASSDTNERYYHGWIPIAGDPGPGPDPELPFDDIANSPFKNDIVWAFDNGITGGCSTNPPLYCPSNTVTRQQMASFLVRALDLPPTSTDYFGDDNNSIHENDINALFEAGVTGGCAAGRFCPTARVTREQMASFLVRGYDLPASSTDYFTDDNSSIHENDIQALRASGVTGGCTATTYCPKAPVTRGQMAAFLHRAETD